MLKPIFLSAEWRNLIMANFQVEPSVLGKYLPANTEIDFWDGRCYISLVGFMFLRTKVLGIPIPFHQDFEEVNLRFYVRHKENSEWRRGVVFIKEIVPKAVITFAANALYGEQYMTLPMRHSWNENKDGNRVVKYFWKADETRSNWRGNLFRAGTKPAIWNHISVKAQGCLQSLVADSEEQFIMEHYWGYTKMTGNRTSEYQVAHPPWQFYPVSEFEIRCSGRQLYGEPFGEILNRKPDSVFLAEGSEISVRNRRII